MSRGRCTCLTSMTKKAEAEGKTVVVEGVVMCTLAMVGFVVVVAAAVVVGLRNFVSASVLELGTVVVRAVYNCIPDWES